MGVEMNIKWGEQYDIYTCDVLGMNLTLYPFTTIGKYLTNLDKIEEKIDHAEFNFPQIGIPDEPDEWDMIDNVIKRMKKDSSFTMRIHMP